LGLHASASLQIKHALQGFFSLTFRDLPLHGFPKGALDLQPLGGDLGAVIHAGE